MPQPTPTSRELARRLIEREAADADAPDSIAGAASAAHRACEHLYHDLARWVGRTGCQALFARALQTARSDYPALAEVSVRADGEPKLGGVAEAVRGSGADATAAGLEGLLVALIELLGRFIGEDMVTTLAERSSANEQWSDARAQGGRQGHGEA